jgi:hypothetical protein
MQASGATAIARCLSRLARLTDFDIGYGIFAVAGHRPAHFRFVGSNIVEAEYIDRENDLKAEGVSALSSGLLCLTCLRYLKIK